MTEIRILHLLDELAEWLAANYSREDRLALDERHADLKGLINRRCDTAGDRLFLAYWLLVTMVCVVDESLGERHLESLLKAQEG